MTDREKRNAISKKYNKANKEKVAVAKKKYREDNKEKIAAYRKKYYEANKEKEAAASKKYKKVNKEKISKYNEKYFLKLSLVNVNISQKTLTAWALQVKNRTPFCEWCYSEDNLEAHHIMPKAKYPQYALDIDNGRTMCQKCHINCHRQGGY